jgi:hypothetical protein
MTKQVIMNVSLTPELEKFVAKKVESGLYQSASVFRAFHKLAKTPGIGRFRHDLAAEPLRF